MTELELKKPSLPTAAPRLQPWSSEGQWTETEKGWKSLPGLGEDSMSQGESRGREKVIQGEREELAS